MIPCGAGVIGVGRWGLKKAIYTLSLLFCLPVPDRVSDLYPSQQPVRGPLGNQCPAWQAGVSIDRRCPGDSDCNDNFYRYRDQRFYREYKGTRLKLNRGRHRGDKVLYPGEQYGWRAGLERRRPMSCCLYIKDSYVKGLRIGIGFSGVLVFAGAAIILVFTKSREVDQ